MINKENTLVIGDSHTYHCFGGMYDIVYLRDITLNKFRQDINPKFSFLEDKKDYKTYVYDKHGLDIPTICSKYDNIIFSIGEIDIRCHLYKFNDSEEKMKELVLIFKEFVKKIDKNIYLLNVILPSNCVNNSTLNSKNIVFLNSEFNKIEFVKNIDLNSIISDGTYIKKEYTDDNIHCNNKVKQLINEKNLLINRNIII